MSQGYILIDNIHKTYNNGTRALQAVSVNISKGEVLTLLGPSGCGKSTLLRIIGGLEKSDGGKVFINGVDITALAPEKRNIGFVFQQYALFPTMTVSENIAFGMRLRKKTKSEQQNKVNELLEMMNIQDLRDRKPAQLSGGQQQRVAVARALAIEPHVLLMDEPLTALDAQLKEKLRLELAQLFRRLKITTIYVTHDQNEAMVVSDRIAVMNKGLIEQNGTPREVYNSPKTPFVAQFIGQINKVEGSVIEVDGIKVSDFGFHKARYFGTAEVGSQIHAYIRPESFRITDDPDGAFKANVKNIVFMGEKSRIVVELWDKLLNVDLYGSCNCNIGQGIYIKVSDDKFIYI